MLFDKNGFYMVDSTKKNYDFAVDIMNGTIDNLSKKYDKYDKYDKIDVQVWDEDKGLKMGTLFPGIYKGYKNYEPGEVKVSNEREKCLLEIQELDFAINDLNLYLDINPSDKGAYELFSKYVKECQKKKDEYMRIYGPLVLEDLTDEYEWPNSVWPWERKGL